jgi:hypothetical protein
MPPIPPKFDQETVDLIESIERRRKDIDTFQLPRLEKCAGPISLQQQYASELRDDIEILAKQIDVSALRNYTPKCGSHVLGSRNWMFWLMTSTDSITSATFGKLRKGSIMT